MQVSPSVADVNADEFMFCPPSGTVWPLDARIVEVTLCPGRCRSIDTVLEVVMCGDGNTMVIGATGVVQRPQVCLLKSSVHTDAYLNGTTSFDAVLFNQTALSATFKWGKPICMQSEDIEINVDPKSGVIEGREKLTVSVNITPHRLGTGISLIVPCRIDGMEETINLSVVADIRNLGVCLVMHVKNFDFQKVS